MGLEKAMEKLMKMSEELCGALTPTREPEKSRWKEVEVNQEREATGRGERENIKKCPMLHSTQSLLWIGTKGVVGDVHQISLEQCQEEAKLPLLRCQSGGERRESKYKYLHGIVRKTVATFAFAWHLLLAAS